MSDELHALRRAIETAIRTHVDGSVAPAVCAACASMVPFDGMGVTVMLSDATREPLFASDATVAAIDMVQYTLGEGPSMVVFDTGRPSLLPDVSDRSVAARWPVLVGEPAWRSVGAVFCFPLRFGAVQVGVTTMYREEAGALNEADTRFTLSAVDLLTLGLLQAEDGPRGGSLLSTWLTDGPGGRPRVHQATGIVMGRLGLSGSDAFARLRAFAYAREASIEQIAEDIVEGRVQIDADQA